MGIASKIISVPFVWNMIQKVLGAPAFKTELYSSVLHPPGKLLDFGCSTGHVAEAFKNFEYYGLDIDSRAIESAKTRFQAYPNMHFLAADIHERPFPEGFFDEVLFAGTVHHLTDELLISILKELSYSLKPGGVVQLLDLVRQDKDRWPAKLMRWMDQGRYTRTLPQIIGLIEPLNLFEIGNPSFHTPYGALLKDCDVVHLSLQKKGV